MNFNQNEDLFRSRETFNSVAPKELQGRGEIFVLLGSALCCFAYFFLNTPYYAALTFAGGALWLFVLLKSFLFSHMQFPFRNNIFKLFFVAILYSLLMVGLQNMVGRPDSFGDLINLSQSMLFFTIGYFVIVNSRTMAIYSSIYALIISVAGYFMIQRMVGGFEVSTGYLVEGKNGLCVIWAVAGGLVFWSFLYARSIGGRILKVIGLPAFILIFICLLTARGRTATLALFIFCFIVLLKKYGRGKLLCVILLSGILLSAIVGYFYFIGVPDFIYQSFFKGRDESDLDSVTSGRAELIEAGIKSLKNNFFTGASIAEFNYINAVHNYPIRVLAAFGLFGAAGYLIAWSCILYSVVKSFFEKNITNFSDIGIFIFIIPLFVSLGEPTQPFGPGTTSGLCFILWGARQRLKEMEKQNKSYFNHKKL